MIVCGAVKEVRWKDCKIHHPGTWCNRNFVEDEWDLADRDCVERHSFDLHAGCPVVKR